MKENRLRSEVEPYIDTYHRGFPILRRHRDAAVVHLLRVFEDAIRLGAGQQIFAGDGLEFYYVMRWAQEAIPWALAWAWTECPLTGDPSPRLNWETYGEATALFNHAFDYYQLFRCYTLYSRGRFSAELDASGRRVRFEYATPGDVPLDTARQSYQDHLRANRRTSSKLLYFIEKNAPVINTILPHYLDKIGDAEIRYDSPAEITEIFQKWARLQTEDMFSELPSSWNFGKYTLGQFRTFWTDLLAVSLLHSFAHMHADAAVGTRGEAVGSVLIHLQRAELGCVGAMSSVRGEASAEIVEDLTYSPQAAYWDPIWQPFVPLADGSRIISPSLVMTSAGERNLLVLLNRIRGKRDLYSLLSVEKEEGQLKLLEALLGREDILVRKRVLVRRPNGTQLSDIDLLVFDLKEGIALLVLAKWLLGPDHVTEVLSKDDEIGRSFSIARQLCARVKELGRPWLSQILRRALRDGPNRVEALIVSQDFLPGGWISDRDVPVVDAEFVRSYAGRSNPLRLSDFYTTASKFDERLMKDYRSEQSHTAVKVGQYTFEIPTFKPVDAPSK